MTRRLFWLTKQYKIFALNLHKNLFSYPTKKKPFVLGHPKWPLRCHVKTIYSQENYSSYDDSELLSVPWNSVHYIKKMCEETPNKHVRSNKIKMKEMVGMMNLLIQSGRLPINMRSFLDLFWYLVIAESKMVKDSAEREFLLSLEASLCVRTLVEMQMLACVRWKMTRARSCAFSINTWLVLCLICLDVAVCGYP